MICHLSSFAGYVIPVPGINILAPFLVWNLKKDSDPYIDIDRQRGNQLQHYLGNRRPGQWPEYFLRRRRAPLPIVIIAGIVLVIIATIKASGGEYYRYPLTIRFMKSQTPQSRNVI